VVDYWWYHYGDTFYRQAYRPTNQSFMDVPGLSLANAVSWSVMGASESKIRQSGKVKPGPTTPLGTGWFILKAKEHDGKAGH
jgi:hypothetical protein